MKQIVNNWGDVATLVHLLPLHIIAADHSDSKVDSNFPTGQGWRPVPCSLSQKPGNRCRVVCGSVTTSWTLPNQVLCWRSPRSRKAWIPTLLRWLGSHDLGNRWDFGWKVDRDTTNSDILERVLFHATIPLIPKFPESFYKRLDRLEYRLPKMK